MTNNLKASGKGHMSARYTSAARPSNKAPKGKGRAPGRSTSTKRYT